MSFLQNLRLIQKFSVIGLLALLMSGVPMALYFHRTAPIIAAAELERQGLAPLTALQDVIRLMQLHRGLSAGMLGGNAKLEARRPGTRDELGKGIAALDAHLQGVVGPQRLAQWAERKQSWTALEQAVSSRQLDPAASSARHTALIAELLNFNGALLDDFALSLDPDADSYALIMAAFGNAPALAERLGQLRAQGTGFLATGSLPPEGRATLIAVKSRAKELYDEMIGNLGKSTAVNGELKLQLGDKADALKTQIGHTLAVAEKDLILATELKMAPDA